MDEVIKSKFRYQNHTDVLYHERTQPTENLILERNNDLRNNPGIIRDLSFGRHVACIPIIIYEEAVRNGYDLNNPDSDIAGMEMARFLKSEKGKLCLVQ